MPAVPMDPDGMHQVVMNLLSNALDAVEAEKGFDPRSPATTTPKIGRRS